MSSNEPNSSPAQRATAAYAKIQDVARRTALVRRKPALVSLRSDDVQKWLKDQIEDLDQGLQQVTEASQKSSDVLTKSVDRVKDIEDRTRKMERAISCAVESAAACDRIIALLTEARPMIAAYTDLKTKDDLESIEADLTSKLTGISVEIEDELCSVEDKLKEIEGDLDPEKVEKILSSVARGGRPLQGFFTKEMDFLRSEVSDKPTAKSESVGKNSDTIPEKDNVVQLDAVRESNADAQKPRPAPMSRMAPPPPTDTLSKAMRKKLGRTMSPFEVEQVSLSYFQNLWKEGVDQSKVAQILYYETKAGDGMTVSDLLEYARGRDILRLAFPEILARFTVSA
jgi:hypothetical protein